METALCTGRVGLLGRHFDFSWFFGLHSTTTSPEAARIGLERPTILGQTFCGLLVRTMGQSLDVMGTPTPRRLISIGLLNKECCTETAGRTRRYAHLLELPSLPGCGHLRWVRCTCGVRLRCPVMFGSFQLICVSLDTIVPTMKKRTTTSRNLRELGTIRVEQRIGEIEGRDSRSFRSLILL